MSSTMAGVAAPSTRRSGCRMKTRWSLLSSPGSRPGQSAVKTFSGMKPLNENQPSKIYTSLPLRYISEGSRRKPSAERSYRLSQFSQKPHAAVASPPLSPATALAHLAHAAPTAASTSLQVRSTGTRQSCLYSRTCTTASNLSHMPKSVLTTDGMRTCSVCLRSRLCILTSPN